MNDAMNAQQFTDLLQRYRSGACTEEEKKLVEAWYNTRRNETYNAVSPEDEQAIGARLYDQITTELGFAPTRRSNRWYWLAAAALIGIVSGTYFFMKPTRPIAVAETTNNRDSSATIVPGGNKALLTLADGSVIVLDSAANDTLSTQGNTVVFKQRDGRLVYQAQGASATTAYNTISTPRGGQYEVVLPDGSKVWLNAATSLRFPASFSANERKVELNGEAYFEVAPMKTAPFLVSFNTNRPGTVEVLGTHFNIMAYADEASINTTLLEGAVRVQSQHHVRTLQPGQQARVTENGNMEVANNVDTEAAIAWKNGYFLFSNSDVQTVMRQIARWYDVEIEYAGKIPAERFEGEIPRNSHISDVVKMLELSNVHCRIEGKKMIILPSK
jgi:Fe2+-dicitrate sensor, membrane component